MTEASDITMKNVNIQSPQKTLITANNAWNIDLNGITFGKNVDTFISATGDKSKAITVSASNVKGLKASTGSAAAAVTVK